MKRSFLTALGLEKEVIDQIMQEHGISIETLKERARETETALKTTLLEAQEALENMPAPDSGDWKSKYEAEAAAHKATRDSYEAEKEAADIDALVSAQLIAAGMNEKAVPKALKLYNRSIVERARDGTIANAAMVLDAFKAEWGDFFGEITQQGAGVGAPFFSAPGQISPKSLNDALRQYYVKE